MDKKNCEEVFNKYLELRLNKNMVLETKTAGASDLNKKSFTSVREDMTDGGELAGIKNQLLEDECMNNFSKDQLLKFADDPELWPVAEKILIERASQGD